MGDGLKRAAVADDQQTIDAVLVIDDAAIEAAGMAVCWDNRPVLGSSQWPSSLFKEDWWRLQGEDERRRYRRAARVACQAFEDYYRAHEREGR